MDESSALSSDMIVLQLPSKMREIPRAIGLCTKLTIISAYGSALDTVPREIKACTNLRQFYPYKSYGFHYLPYEIIRCGLTETSMSTRALYMNRKNDWPLPSLDAWPIDHALSALLSIAETKSIIDDAAVIATLSAEAVRHSLASEIKPGGGEAGDDDYYRKPPLENQASLPYSALQLKHGTRTARMSLFVTVVTLAIPNLLHDLVALIGDYTSDALGCSLCQHQYVGRPYMCWTYRQVALSDFVALLCHMCSLECALRVDRFHYDPNLGRHVHTKSSGLPLLR